MKDEIIKILENDGPYTFKGGFDQWFDHIAARIDSLYQSDAQERYDKAVQYLDNLGDGFGLGAEEYEALKIASGLKQRRNES